jgi:hypothetical protein
LDARSQDSGQQSRKGDGGRQTRPRQGDKKLFVGPGNFLPGLSTGMEMAEREVYAVKGEFRHKRTANARFFFFFLFPFLILARIRKRGFLKDYF